MALWPRAAIATRTSALGKIASQTGRGAKRPGLTDSVVSLTVTLEGVVDLDPPEAVVSFRVPDELWDQGVIQAFCHSVLFFATRGSGERWTAEHPGTLLLSVTDAYEVGRRTNARQFGDALESPESAQTA